MRTLDSMSRSAQLKISSETIYIYSPLAHRLGLYSIKSELDDLYLKYTDRKKYKLISKKIKDSKSSRDKFIRSFFMDPLKTKAWYRHHSECNYYFPSLTLCYSILARF